MKNQNIWDKRGDDNSPTVKYDFPRLEGDDIGEHFHKLGMWSLQNVKNKALNFSQAELPSKLPEKWSLESGWTRYDPETGATKKVNYPQEREVVFDVETLVKEGNVPVLATAASEKAWYSWVSPYLSGDSQDCNHLIPWGSNTKLNKKEKSKDPRIIIAHFASFDRARVETEYNLQNSENVFIDTASLHVAIGGLSSIQRGKYLKFHRALKKDDLESFDSEDISSISKIISVGTVNSLKDVYKLYCEKDLDKQARDVFIDGNREEVLEKFQESMQYCALDVKATHEVYKIVLNLFFEKCPHPVTFAGMNIMGKAFLPTNTKWNDYIENSEKIYTEMLQNVETKLLELANEAKEQANPQDDPWLQHLDWTRIPLKMTKERRKKDGTLCKNGESRPYSRQTLPGEPEWYRSLYIPAEKRVKVTTRTRVAPYLLKLQWLGYPLYYSTKYGWTYVADINDTSEKLTQKPLVFITDPEHKQYEPYPNDNITKKKFFKVPHKDGDDHNVGNPIAKGYVKFFEDETMTSEYPLAEQALKMNAMCAYWISARDRVKSQFVSWQKEGNSMGIEPEEGKSPSDYGMIIPQISTMGTVTRRAVEATWMTASNAKNNRIGSELKSLVIAPPGYKIVGADVDSEELWISSLIGDSQFKDHGATAFGWMNLQGSKSDGTDLHSKTADILGISRGDAKIFNYGRIYGAGVKFAVQLLIQFNPNMSEKQAKEKANQLYKETKGAQNYGPKSNDLKNKWYGGSESFMFNKLEAIAKAEDPRTPVLNCGIPNALKPECVNEGYMTSRVNWVVQSSGVDYLHLLLVAMDYLTHKFNIDARFMISVHDEVRYLVKEKDTYRAALALQISNLWTRAVFSYRLGLNNLPQSVAFFSSVDIDHVLRKEVDLDCVTPSNPEPIPFGESVNIHQLIEKMNGDRLSYNSPKPFISQFNSEITPEFVKAPISSGWTPKDILYLRLQNCKDLAETKKIELDAIKSGCGKTISRYRKPANANTFRKSSITNNTIQSSQSSKVASGNNTRVSSPSTSRPPFFMNRNANSSASSSNNSASSSVIDANSSLYKQIANIGNGAGYDQKQKNRSIWANTNVQI